MADRLFLDANVLFSAAYGSPSIERLWDAQRAGSCRLLVSCFVIEEARRNLGKPEQIRRLDDKLEATLVVPESPADRCPLNLPDKDRPVFSAAMAARATHLITGDRRHFGAYYGTMVAGLTILRPSDYLIRGAAQHGRRAVAGDGKPSSVVPPEPRYPRTAPPVRPLTT